MGLQLAATVGFGTWGGYWVDSRWNCSPWGIVVGAAAGAGAGLTIFLLDVLRMSKNETDDNTK